MVSMLQSMEFNSINEQIAYYYRNGWKIKDIAVKTGLSVSAVKSRLQRMRKTKEVKRWWV